MAIEERVEDAVRGAIMQTGQTGVKMIVHVGAAVAQKMLAAGWKLTQNAAHTATTAVNQAVTGGRVSERKLQTLGDVHALKLDESTMPQIAKSLRQAGITYSVDQAQDGNFTLLFQGQDSDHVLHAVNRAFEHLGISFNEESVLTATHTRQPQQAQPTLAGEAMTAMTAKPRVSQAGKPKMKTKEELLGRLKTKYQNNLDTARAAAAKPRVRTPKINK